MAEYKKLEQFSSEKNVNFGQPYPAFREWRAGSFISFFLLKD